MECVYDEVMDAGTECIADSWSWEVLTSLYGDLDVTEFDADWPCDYDAATKGADVAAEV
jgi:hypothetical protein